VNNAPVMFCILKEILNVLFRGVLNKVLLTVSTLSGLSSHAERELGLPWRPTMLPVPCLLVFNGARKRNVFSPHLRLRNTCFKYLRMASVCLKVQSLANGDFSDLLPSYTQMGDEQGHCLSVQASPIVPWSQTPWLVCPLVHYVLLFWDEPIKHFVKAI
jgi:hypothetical protein